MISGWVVNTSDDSLISDSVASTQKFKFANELIEEIRTRTSDTSSITILAAGYPEGHVESQNPAEDLQNLKKKVECGVDVILTQVVFSSGKFVEFVKNCRKIEITSRVPIIPGLHIPRTFKELNFLLNFTKATMPKEIFNQFQQLEHQPEAFEDLALSFTIKLIQEINESSPEFIRGFHFFTMNHLKMVKKLLEVIDFM